MNPLSRRALQFRTYLRLGASNLVRVGIFRLKKKHGWFAKHFPVRVFQGTGPFIAPGEKFHPELADAERKAVIKDANAIIAGKAIWYGHAEFDTGFPPNWFSNPFNGQRLETTEHWTTIAEPNPVGDIKDIWELSRFEALPTLALAYRETEDRRYLDAVNSYLQAWCHANPAQGGPNWMCGQETSIRLINTLRALELCSNPLSPLLPSLAEFMAHHLIRVEYGLSYAIGQDNNHGLSESVVLAMGGAMLMQNDPIEGARLRDKGLSITRERCARLFFEDGGFSQYSVTYHRLALDTLVVLIRWMTAMGAPLDANDEIVKTTERATRWLEAMVDPQSGDAPNLGANDGANPYRAWLSQPYRDFRPTLKRALKTLALPSKTPETSWLARDFSIARIPSGSQKSRAYLRGANFRFRPAHSDAGHVDVWMDGKAVMTDCGTYRYTLTGDEKGPDLAAAQAHNTVLLNNQDPMVRLSRFLFGKWTKANLKVEQEGALFSMALPNGGKHTRKVWFDGDDCCIIEDVLPPCNEPIILRFHLSDSDWHEVGTAKERNAAFENASYRLQVEGNLANSECLPAFMSTHYAKLETLSVFVLTVAPSADETHIVTQLQRKS